MLDLLLMVALIIFAIKFFKNKWEVVFISPPVLLIIYDNICYIPFIDISFSIPWIFNIYHIISVFLFMFTIIIMFGYQKDFNKNIIFIKKNYLILFFYIIFSIFIINLIINKSGFGTVLNLLSEFNRFYALIRGTGDAGSAFLLFLIFPLFLIPSIVLISGYRKLFWFLMIFLFPFLLFTGARTILMLHLLYNFLLYFIIKGNKKVIFNMFLSLFLVILLGTLFRSGFTLMDIDEYLTTFGKLDLNNLFVLKDSIEFSEKKLLYGYTLYDIFIWLIPRSLWLDKPISTIGTYEVYPAVAERGTNYTFGLYGNSIINFGEIGSLITLFFFTVIFTIVFYKIYLVYRYKFFSKNILYLILFYSFIIFFIRAGIFTHFWIIYIYYATFLYLYLFSVKRILNVTKPK